MTSGEVRDILKQDAEQDVRQALKLVEARDLDNALRLLYEVERKAGGGEVAGLEELWDAVIELSEDLEGFREMVIRLVNEASKIEPGIGKTGPSITSISEVIK